MKKLFALLIISILIGVGAAAGNALFSGVILAGNQVIRIGATPVPHAEILEFIKPLLAEQGIELEVVEFTDYVAPNLALADGSINANYFQHLPYLEQFKEDHNLALSSLVKVHIEPLGLYSQKIDSLDGLISGSIIALPNDPTNEGRALLLLAAQGLIELEAGAGLKATPLEISKNPLDLQFRELEAAQLPRVLPDVTAAFINTNYALEAGLNPLKDALLIEGSESPYANILAVRTEDLADPLLAKLAAVLTNDPVRQFILEKYQGAVVPVF